MSWTQTYHYYHLKDTQFSSLLRFTCSASTINLLHWLILVFLIVLAPKMIKYLNKCTELKIYIRLVSSLFVYMSKILIDGLLFEILKSQLKLMDEWKNVISQLLKWWDQTCGISVFSCSSFFITLMVHLIKVSVQTL